MAALRKEKAEDLHLGCGWKGGSAVRVRVRVRVKLAFCSLGFSFIEYSHAA